MPEQYYERHLPHQIPEDTPLFLTWNLKGAITRQMRDCIEEEGRRLERMGDKAGETPAQRRLREGKLLFAFQDRLLGETTQGPLYLKDPKAAQVVVDAILFGVLERYDLFAFVVMANHLHVLLTPRIALARITKGLKGYTSYRINELHNCRGRIVWQDESYDHWVRDEEEFFRIIDYIERNPVQAGLCARCEDWLWSSASLRSNWPVGQSYPVESIYR
jgi:type I restriction enzyme R subunit